MTSDHRLIRRILALCVATGVACGALFALLRGPAAGGSALAGALLGAGNLALMVLLVRVSLDEQRPRWLRLTAGFALSIKTVVLLLVVAGLLMADVVRPVAFI